MVWPCKYIHKFEVRSFTCSWDKRRVAKLQTHNLEEGEAIGVGDGTIEKSVGQFLLALHTFYSSISTRLPEIVDCSFQWGLWTPILGRGRT